MFETFIVNPLITVLAVLYSVFGNNIVLAIVVLTIVIRLATSPLLIRQQQSAAKMQEIQPQVKKLQEKYKNDREKLAQEQMKLFREAGVNPLGGCLPLLVQLPILIALYQAIIYGLSSTPFQVVDMSERFLLPGLGDLVPLQNMWAGMDLTLPPTVNPAYALAFPLLVFVTTWLQSKLTLPAPQPTEGDKPDQATQMTRTMTTIMPVMFAFFSLSFSVGLSIYFVVSNVVGIVQYTLMGKAKWGQLFGRGEEAQPAVVKGKAVPAAAGADGGSSAGPEVRQAGSGSKPKQRKDKKMKPRESRK
ncbi:MAG: membrane protein insertase YidC [Chloroflexota bacterium]